MNPDPMPSPSPEAMIPNLSKPKGALGKTGFIIAAVPWIFFLISHDGHYQTQPRFDTRAT
jgi:hypothetical protein